MPETLRAGKDVINFVALCYMADLPPGLAGAHGVAKSALLKAAAKRLGIEAIPVDLSLKEPCDLTGLIGTNDAKETIYFTPKFLPKTGQGLLALEELNRCTPQTRAPSLQLLTERSLNDYGLPAGWLPAAAWNYAENGGDYETDELDGALLSRFVKCIVTPDVGEWLKWARGEVEEDLDAEPLAAKRTPAPREHHPAVVNYARSDLRVFAHPDSNPRAWSYLHQFLYAWERHSAELGASTPVLRAAACDLVGHERGTAFLRFYRAPVKPLTAKEVVTAYGKHRSKVQSWVADGKLDLVSSSLDNVLKHVQSAKNYGQLRKKTRSGWKFFGWFLQDLPADKREEAIAMLNERGYDIPNLTK